MEHELYQTLRQYPDYHVKGMMYDECNASWGWLCSIYVNHLTKCIELTFDINFKTIEL